MEQNKSTQQLNNYELKRQQKLEEERIRQRKKTVKQAIKTVIIIAAILGPIAGLVWYGMTRPEIPETDIVSKQGLHWHPELSIEIKGQKQEIPANIGIGAAHNPIHTHDANGQIHLEMQGLVKKDDLRLAQFFKVWGKQFNSTCILDSCNGTDGVVKMFVNGNENTEFENYQMNDKDKIEIKYEAI